MNKLEPGTALHVGTIIRPIQKETSKKNNHSLVVTVVVVVDVVDVDVVFVVDIDVVVVVVVVLVPKLKWQEKFSISCKQLIKTPFITCGSCRVYREDSTSIHLHRTDIEHRCISIGRYCNNV